MNTTTLYHVSPSFNTALILDQGVLPERSRGKEQVFWCVDLARITWALAHVSERWKVSVNNLVVFEMVIDVSLLYRTRLAGVYKLSVPCKVRSADPARVYLE